MGSKLVTFLLCCQYFTFWEKAHVMGTVSNKEIEELSLKAIKAIHKHLDDDQDGAVNLQESNEFMVDELNMEDKKRHSSFHHNDSLISVEDLWHTWKGSEVHNWTNEDVVRWLTNLVGLPQYKDTFYRFKIDGRMLPRFTNESSNLYVDLGITNLKHRKKIYLQATDIVLFGLPNRDYTRDIILAAVVVLMTLACLYAFSERKSAKRQIEQMLKDVEFMQQAEDNLKNTQEKLMEAEKEYVKTERSKREIEEKLREEISAAKQEAERLHTERSHHEEERVKLSLVEQELFEVRKALQKAETEMESMKPKSFKALQQWLIITYRKESKHFIGKKSKALSQMQEAKDACDKIHRKRNSIFGPLRLVHGQSIDEVDQKILQARKALAEVTNDMQERQHRWRQIEELCGFPIVCDGLLGYAVEFDETTRRSSIAEALAICANLGGIGSFPDANQKTLPSSCSEPVKDSLPSVNSQRSDLEYKPSYQQNINEALSNSGRSSPIDVRSSHSRSLTSRTSCGSEKMPRHSKSFDDCDANVFPENKPDSTSEKSYQECDAKEINGKEIHHSNPMAENSLKGFHVSQSTPAFSTLEHAPTRSFSMTSDGKGSTHTRDSNSKDGGMSLNKIATSSKDITSFEIFSSDENFIGLTVKRSSDDPAIIKTTSSCEELSSGIKKKTKKSLKSKKPLFDEVSIKSTDGSEVSKKRSIFSKLRKK